MTPRSRTLDEASTNALIGVLSILETYLIEDELDHDLGQRLVESCAQSGVLAAGASLGDLTVALRELTWLLQFNAGYIDELPQSHRSTTYLLNFTNHDNAKACMNEITSHHNPIGVSITQEPRSGKWTVLATFPTLPPNPDHQNQAKLAERIAEKHGGYFSGWQGGIEQQHEDMEH